MSVAPHAPSVMRGWAHGLGTEEGTTAGTHSHLNGRKQHQPGRLTRRHLLEKATAARGARSVRRPERGG